MSQSPQLPPIPQPANPANAGTPYAPHVPYTPYGGYPAYGYPVYAGYPAYYPYPAYQPPTPPRSPSERPGRPGAARVRNLVLALVALVLTLAAIGAAAATAATSQSVPAPTSGGLNQVYGQQLTSDTANWDVNHGCSFANGGLLADGSAGNAICTFVPSTQQDLLSQGFQLTAVMAPAGAVATQEEGIIAVGSDQQALVLDFDQQGDYNFTMADNTRITAGSTIAWHADPSLPNTITVRYASNDLTVYVNGQEVFVEGMRLNQGAAMSLGAPSGSQSLFTSFALYSAGATGQ